MCNILNADPNLQNLRLFGQLNSRHCFLSSVLDLHIRDLILDPSS